MRLIFKAPMDEVFGIHASTSMHMMNVHIWTVGGSVLEEGIFIPYDGRDAALRSDLQIAQQGGTDVIKLQNGRYLIPASGSGHEAAVRYLNFMTGKTKSFDTKKASEN